MARLDMSLMREKRRFNAGRRPRGGLESESRLLQAECMVTKPVSKPLGKPRRRRTPSRAGGTTPTPRATTDWQALQVQADFAER